MLARSLKLLHELGSIGMLGSVAACLILLRLHAGDLPPGFAAAGGHAAEIVRWLLMPCFIAVLLSGLLGIAATPAYINAGWVWFKALLGLSIFEASLALSSASVRVAELSAAATAGAGDPLALGQALRSERGMLWVLLGVSVFSVILGIWRPRFGRQGSAVIPRTRYPPG